MLSSKNDTEAIRTPEKSRALDGGTVTLATLDGKKWIVLYQSRAHYASQQANY
jgi:hypothetical protein